MPGRFVVVGAGDWFGAPALAQGDFLVAADGGYRRLREEGLTPQLVVGDFDSAPPPQGLDTVRLPVMKDDTDMLAALRIGLKKGYTRFALYGGTGGRLDHTLANIQCLHFLARQGARGTLYGQAAALTAIRGGGLSFPAGAQGTLSAFSLTSRCRGVCIEGMKYNLQDATVQAHFPIGVSNQFTGAPARIGVKQGVLLVVYPRGVKAEEEANPSAKE